MIIHANVILISSYAVAVISSIVVGLLLRIPLVPERPMRQSWTISIVFPTAVLALGFSAIVFKLGVDGLLVAAVIGIITALFSKYILERVLPEPLMEES
ncbi:MAG: energy-converting hydrogenase A subunit A EhaA [Methanobacterium sp. ERen5]|nr:MAG: energy-converting hydrogenase A subunit A EhaA [Methanobacterium sp. ERen5]